MPNNVNTGNESEHPVLDAEDWEIALEPYKGNPDAALMLGFHLMVLKTYLVIEPFKIYEAVAAIDLACEVLFPHTQFHEVSYDLFRRVIEGKLTLEEEEILKSLNIKF